LTRSRAFGHRANQEPYTHADEQADQEPECDSDDPVHGVSPSRPRRGSASGSLGWAKEVIGLHSALRLNLDPLHHVATWQPLTGEIPVNRLDTDADPVGESRDRDIPVDEVLPELHPAMFTGLVNSVNSEVSPSWRWRVSPVQRPCRMPNRIRELRVARNLTLEEIAERVGTSVQQISSLELGDRRLTDDWMRRIASALNVQPADLFTDSRVDDREIVQNIQEIKLLRFWRLLSMEEKRMIAAFARAKGLEILNDNPKKRSA